MIKNLLVATAAVLALSPVASNAALSNSWLSNMSVSLGTDPVTNNETVYVVAKLTSNVGIQPITLPILNPKKPSEVLGTVSLVTDITGRNYSLQIALNVSSALKAKALGLGLLPNGTMIPIAVANPMNWLSLALPNKMGSVYLNLDLANRSAIVGAAVNAAALGTGFPINLLVPFNVKNIGGLAGIYTGAKGQGGLGVFVDTSTLFKK